MAITEIENNASGSFLIIFSIHTVYSHMHKTQTETFYLSNIPAVEGGCTQSNRDINDSGGKLDGSRQEQDKNT